MTLQRGTGFHADLEGLHLHVEVLDEGWSYKIFRGNSNETVKDWTLPPHASTTQYGEPENSKFAAVAEGLSFLGRRDSDAHQVLRELRWKPYGPGHRP